MLRPRRPQKPFPEVECPELQQVVAKQLVRIAGADQPAPQSDATYKVVFGDSRVEKAFATYDFGLRDFHRELHWVEGQYNPADRQRILLKCNYLVTRRNAALLGWVALAANTSVFYVVKSAMEYCKSPSTPPQVVVGLLCNLFRRLNNIHPLIPLALIAAVVAALGWAIGRLLT